MSVGPRVCAAWVSCYTRAHCRRMSRSGGARDRVGPVRARSRRAPNGIRESSFTIEVFGRVLSGMPADLSWRRAVRKEPLTRFVIGGSTMESPRPRLDMAYMLMLVVDIAIVIAILPAWGFGCQRPHVRHVVVADHRVARRRVAHAFQHADALAGMRHVGIHRGRAALLLAATRVLVPHRHDHPRRDGDAPAPPGRDLIRQHPTVVAGSLDSATTGLPTVCMPACPGGAARLQTVLRASISNKRGMLAASRYSCALARKPSGGAGSSIRSISKPCSRHGVHVLRQRPVHERQQHTRRGSSIVTSGVR